METQIYEKKSKSFYFCMIIVILTLHFSNAIYATQEDSFSEGSKNIFESVKDTVIETGENIIHGIGLGANAAFDVIFGDGIQSWHNVTNAVTDTVTENVSNYISDTIMDGLCAWLFNFWEDIANGFLDIAFTNFQPDVQYFLQQTVHADKYFAIFKPIGYTISLFMYAFMIVIILSGYIGLAEVKENPWQLTGRLAISFIFITRSEDICDCLYAWTNAVYTDLLNMDADMTAADALYSAFVPRTLTEHLIAGLDGGNTLSINPVGMILCLVLGFIFVIQFIKFVLEIVERYIISCLLYYVFPLPASTIVSKNASSIFKKYFQMVCVQLLMLIMNLLFIKIIINMLLQQSFLNSLTGWLFMLGFIKVAQKIDNYAYSMGLSVAVTGGSVLDACRGAAYNIMNMTRGLQAGLSMGGNAMIKQGANAGRADLINLGSKMRDLAHPTRPQSADTMQQAFNEARRHGMDGKMASNITPGMVDESVVNMAKSGKAYSAINQMPLNTQKEIFDKAYGKSILPEDSQIDSLAWDIRGDCNGQITSHGETGDVSGRFTISDKPTDNNIREFTDEKGNSFFVSGKSNLGVGQTVGYEFDPKNPDKLTTAEIATGRSFEGLGAYRNDIKSVKGGENGTITMHDHSGNTVAKMEKNGSIHLNNDRALSGASLSKIPAFKDMSNIRLKDNKDGTVTARGYQTTSTGSVGSTQDIKEFMLYNRALFNKEDVSSLGGAGAITSFGSANSGSWYVKENNLKGKANDEKRIKAENEYNDMHETLAVPKVTNYGKDW